MELTSLPVELILKVFSILDWRTLLVCRQVCSLFHSVIEGSGKAQYDIELAVSGMTDSPLCPLNAVDRLALLREHNAAWESLRWKESSDMPMQQGRVWELCGGVFAQSSTSNALHFHRLPSQYRKIKEKSWHVVLDIQIRDFTMDPGQDLLVVVEQTPLPSNPTEMDWQIRIHLRSLTTGHKHKLASHPAILAHDLDVQGIRPTEYILLVCGDLLGVCFISHRAALAPELTVWNWVTGNVVLTRFCPAIASFTFLNSRFLLVGSSIDIDTAQPSLYVLDMAHSSSEKIALTADYFCAFAWPRFSTWTSLVAFMIRSDPSPARGHDPDAQLPFSVAHQYRLIVITSWALTADGHESSYDLFVTADTLLSHIEALPTNTFQCDIDWDEWGPTGTRLMPTPLPHSLWVCYVFGTKFATVVTPGVYSDILEVRDFNQLAIKRAADSSKNLAFQEGVAQHVYDSSVIEAGLFENDVRTSLPYRFTRRTLSRPFTQTLSAVMCSEDNLILVDSMNRHARLLTF